ncbi:TolC family protein [Acinetobacter sp.]|jgi:outer membrane protein TolC|uniref:TolC family protein n=1 Tax=Acinetobacter sp. TaxID=472 RepID=UPI00281C0B42|nr:TolC family protein [Acinetobacter sp.]MDR2250675.1 TolC family protein [Acinetobacter sp.]
MRKLSYCILIILTGCTTYHPQPIVPAQLVQQFESRSLDSEDLHQYIQRELGQNIAWPLPHWNREMLTLAAFYYSPTLDIARAQATTSQAGVDVARAIPNPVLQLPSQYASNAASDSSPWTLGFALDIPIETAHKRGYHIAQASHLSQAARLNLSNEIWNVSAQVRDALLTLYAARERITLLSQQVLAEQQIAAMSRKRLAVGQFSRPEVNAALLADTQAQSDLAAARNAEQNALAALAAVIGVPVSTLKQLDFDFSVITSPPIVPSTEMQQQAIFQRADLLASLANYAAAESTLQLEVAKQYPDIHLGPGYTYDMGTHKIAFGLAGISLPIFDQNQGGIHLAEAQRKEAAARTTALQDKILADLAQALSRYQSSQQAMQLAIHSQSIAQQQLNSQSHAFHAGNLDRLSYTQAQVAYQTSQLNTLDAKVNVMQSAALLEDALQRNLDHGIFTQKKTTRMGGFAQ